VGLWRCRTPLIGNCIFFGSFLPRLGLTARVSPTSETGRGREEQPPSVGVDRCYHGATFTADPVVHTSTAGAFICASGFCGFRRHTVYSTAIGPRFGHPLEFFQSPRLNLITPELFAPPKGLAFRRQTLSPFPCFFPV